MKKNILLVFILFIILCLLFYSVYERKNLKKDLINLEARARESLNNKKINLENSIRLENVKKEKEQDILRYNEVEEWNQEIKKYLD